MTNAAANTIPALSLDPGVAALQELRDQLEGCFFERTAEVRALLVALIAGEHVLFLGDPGTGKSALTQAFAEAISDAGYFQRLVTKFSVPEEVFGPFSLKGLENDRYERKVEGYLPTAEVAFLDEIFKANSAILNSLLTVLNERAFDNGTDRIACPLKVCVGASNELPNNDEGDSLDALYDRFTLRRWVMPLQSRESRRKLLRMSGAPAVSIRITAEQIEDARALARVTSMTEAAEDALLDLQEALQEELGLTMSDRRLRKCQKILAAWAVLQGRVDIIPADLEILADSLWSKPEERAPILGQILKVANPNRAVAMTIFDAAVEAFSGVALQSVTLDQIAPISALRNTLKEMASGIRGMDQEDLALEVDKMLTEVNQAINAAFAK